MCLNVLHSLPNLALKFNPLWVLIQYSDFTSAFIIRYGVILTVSGYSWKFWEDETFIDVVKYRHLMIIKTAEILHIWRYDINMKKLWFAWYISNYWSHNLYVRKASLSSQRKKVCASVSQLVVQVIFRLGYVKSGHIQLCCIT